MKLKQKLSGFVQSLGFLKRSQKWQESLEEIFKGLEFFFYIYRKCFLKSEFSFCFG